MRKYIYNNKNGFLSTTLDNVISCSACSSRRGGRGTSTAKAAEPPAQLVSDTKIHRRNVIPTLQYQAQKKGENVNDGTRARWWRAVNVRHTIKQSRPDQVLTPAVDIAPGPPMMACPDTSSPPEAFTGKAQPTVRRELQETRRGEPRRGEVRWGMRACFRPARPDETGQASLLHFAMREYTVSQPVRLEAAQCMRYVCALPPTHQMSYRDIPE